MAILFFLFNSLHGVLIHDDMVMGLSGLALWDIDPRIILFGHFGCKLHALMRCRNLLNFVFYLIVMRVQRLR